jgi:hypothetical protein
MRASAMTLACFIVAGCGGPSEKDWQSAASWSLTAVVVGRYWADGDVPTPYARRALKKAADELGKGPLPEAAAPVDELREALERGDREAVRRLVRELSAR